MYTSHGSLSPSFGFLLLAAQLVACGGEGAQRLQPTSTGASTTDDGDSGGTGSTGSTMPPADDDTGDASTSGGTSPTSDVTTTDAADETTTSAPACDPTSTCLPGFDASWSGPVAVREGTECAAGPFALVEATVHSGLDAPPASCTCECDAEGTATCDTSAVEVRAYGSDDCTGTSDSWVLNATVCDAVVSVAAGSSVFVSEVPVQGISCDADFTESVPPAAFVNDVVLCGVDSRLDVCDGEGRCVPAPSEDDAVCIWAEGDLECPGAWAEDRRVYHRDFTDDRACSDCSCGAFEGVCTGYSVQLFGTNTCNEAPVGGVSAGSCGALGAQGATAARRSGVGTPQVDCSGEAEGGAAIGSAEPASPVTVCCQPSG